MFENKQSFKEEYARRLLETYGVSVEKSHITERYAVLGEMVRDYANVDWSKTHMESIQGKRSFMVQFEWIKKNQTRYSMCSSSWI